MIKYRLLKEPITEHIKRLGQSYKSVSRYMTENQDDNWLNNRTNRARSTLVDFEHVEKLAWLLGVDPDEISAEVDDSEHKQKQQPQQNEITITITQDQWNNLLHLVTSAVRDGVSAALKNE